MSHECSDEEYQNLIKGIKNGDFTYCYTDGCTFRFGDYPVIQPTYMNVEYNYNEAFLDPVNSLYRNGMSEDYVGRYEDSKFNGTKDYIGRQKDSRHPPEIQPTPPVEASIQNKRKEKKKKPKLVKECEEELPQKMCCIMEVDNNNKEIGCYRVVKNRTLNSLKLKWDFKPECMEKGFKKICTQHYFKDLYQYKVKKKEEKKREEEEKYKRKSYEDDDDDDDNMGFQKKTRRSSRVSKPKKLYY